MKKIENIMQLQFEISRLRSVAKEQEQQLRNDLIELKYDLKPANIFLNLISSFKRNKTNKKDFLKDGIVYGLSMLIDRFILKAERKLEDKIYSFMDVVFERIKIFMQEHNDYEENDKSNGQAVN